MNINERRLRDLFAAEGFEVIRARRNRHWVSMVTRIDGSGPTFMVTCSQSPSDHRFPHQFRTALKRAEKAERSAMS
jgi:hypothetical protein